MYKRNKMEETTIKTNKSYEGETIEAKVRRIMNNKEAITDAAPIIYTERKDGVRPEMNIRTDRNEIALEAMDYLSKSATMKREMNIGERGYEGMTKEQKEEHIKKFPNSKYNKNEGKEGESKAQPLSTTSN